MASNPSDAVSPTAASQAANYTRLRAYFDECVDLPEGQRLSWIERYVPDDGMRLELALMLASDAGETDMFGAPPLQKLGDYLGGAAVVRDLSGTRCGAFRLVRVLGSGGQGTVYLGERDGDDFGQSVAVKLMRQARLDTAELRRFRRERDILARFEHAGVARLIDAGISASGLPFLVMEYVDGEQIDLWCIQQGLGMSERLQLFAELCEVIAAAHRQLIVHRDLKPSNVLVSTEGRIKVLDFGIACLLDENGDARTHTQMLTPGYGAPEQRTGEPVTPASDVFALGAMLRELIAEQSPPRRSDEAWPPWPVNIPEELRWIFERCAAADLSERYRDAAELHEDMDNFRCRRPVRAHPPSGWYRARKFASRHRGGVTLTAILVVTTLLGFGSALWQARVAQRHSAHAIAEAQRAKATSDFLLSVFEAAQEDLPQDARPTPDVLAQVAAKKLDEDATVPDQTRSDFLSALARVARSGNDPATALSLYERAMATLDRAPHGVRDRLRLDVAHAWVLSELGRAAEAALAPRLAALRNVPDATAVDGLWAYARALGELGRSEAYLAALDEARTVAAQAYAPEALVPIQIEGDYGLALHEFGRHREAADITVALLRRWRDAGHPVQRDYAVGLHNLALMYRALGDLGRAEASIREALSLSARIHPGPHADTAFMQQLLARILIERGQPDDAEAPLRSALAVLVKQLGTSHRGTIGAANVLGQLHMERFHFDAAIDTLQGVDAICVGIVDGPATNACTSTRQLLADAFLHAGRLDEAADMAQRALQKRQSLDGDDSSDNGPPQRILAEVRLAQGRPADALALLDAAIERYGRAGIDQNLDVAAQREARARALLALGNADAALADVDLAAPILVRLAPDHQGRRLRLLATRAAVLSALSRHKEARASAGEGLALKAARAVLATDEWAQLQAIARRPD